MNLVDALLRVYPPAWRQRHGAEVRDALSLTAGPSGRLPFREVRSTLAAGLQERARGDSTSTRELVRASLGDSFIFISGLIIGAEVLLSLRDGFPKSLYPSILLVLALAVFVSSMISSKLFRVCTVSVGPLMWLAAHTITQRPRAYHQTETHLAGGAAGLAAYGALGFVGLALVLKRRFVLAGLLFTPTVVVAAFGAVEIWKKNGSIPAARQSVDVRLAWSLVFLVLRLVMTGIAALVHDRRPKAFGQATSPGGLLGWTRSRICAHCGGRRSGRIRHPSRLVESAAGAHRHDLAGGIDGHQHGVDGSLRRRPPRRRCTLAASLHRRGDSRRVPPTLSLPGAPGELARTVGPLATGCRQNDVANWTTSRQRSNERKNYAYLQLH